ncbi:MAG: hypothetical protein NZV14_14800 [Bryobacteraceae bacterium]|nr:hypothetical protein [Bryobacteraceae bacterium]MDW8379432.1 hypothetical protein [Bryobacterales bacterium]
MRLTINLATEPFRRERPYLVAAWALGSLLTVTLGVFTYLALLTDDLTREARAEVQKAEQLVRSLAAEQARLEAVLRQPENSEVIERSIFLNQLLLRKSISWTRMFSDLEKVIPHSVRIISIRPQVTPENQVYLEMVVGAQSSEPVVEMLMRLESSPQFGATQVNSMLPPSQTEPLYRYRVSVNYAQKL